MQESQPAKSNKCSRQVWWTLQHSFRAVTSSPAYLCPEDCHPPIRSKRGHVCALVTPRLLQINKCAVRHQSVTLEANCFSRPICQFYHRGSNHGQSHSWSLHILTSYTALTRSSTACLSHCVETPNIASIACRALYCLLLLYLAAECLKWTLTARYVFCQLPEWITHRLQTLISRINRHLKQLVQKENY